MVPFGKLILSVYGVAPLLPPPLDQAPTPVLTYPHNKKTGRVTAWSKEILKDLLWLAAAGGLFLYYSSTAWAGCLWGQIVP